MTVVVVFLAGGIGAGIGKQRRCRRRVVLASVAEDSIKSKGGRRLAENVWVSKRFH